MNEKSIRTSIKSYEERMRYEKQRAHIAIDNGELAIAALAIADAAKYKGAIEELEFILECMEVE